MPDTARIISRDRHDQLGEGALWSARDRALYWVDIVGRRVNRLALDGGAVDGWEVPDTIGWVIEREMGGFIAGLGREIVALTLDPVTITPFASPEPEPEHDGNRMNDAVADARGRIWAGTMALDEKSFTGSLYRLDPGVGLTRVDTGYCIANGPAVSADGRHLYHTDTAQQTVYRFALAEGGMLGERETFIRFEEDWGHPDGMTVDAQGGIWIAHWGGARVSRFSPDGELDRAIPLPASQITSCTFAGDDLDRMFVTSAAIGLDEPHGGALFEIDPGCRGLPTHRFAG